MKLNSVNSTLNRLIVVGLALWLAACASGPQTGRVADLSSVRVAGGVNRDFERSVAYIEEGNYSAAIELLHRVTEREQRLPAPYVNLGIAYFNSGNEKAAEESLLKALQVAPDHPVAANELAVLYRKQGRFDEARQSYTKALARNPDNLPLIKNFGILCDLYLQDVNCALAQFQEYLKYAPEDQDVGVWLADLQRRAGN